MLKKISDFVDSDLFWKVVLVVYLAELLWYFYLLIFIAN